MTIDGESYDPFSAETLRVLPPTHPSYQNEIINASRRKYSIPKDAAAKLIAQEEATIIRSSEEKAIIEGKTRSREDTGGTNGGDAGNQSQERASQEAEPMI